MQRKLVQKKFNFIFKHKMSNENKIKINNSLDTMYCFLKVFVSCFLSFLQ